MADALDGLKSAAAVRVARGTLSKAVSKCGEYSVLVWLLESLPFTGPHAETQVLAALLKALARLLGTKGALRLDFMQRGALTLAQEGKGSPDKSLQEALKALNATYPSQMVAATDPNYESSLLAKIN